MKKDKQAPRETRAPSPRRLKPPGHPGALGRPEEGDLWKEAFFPGSRGASHPVWCVCFHFSPCGAWSECGSHPRGCWHVTRGVCVGISLMSVCGGQQWCGPVNTVLVRYVPTQVFLSVRVTTHESVC